MTALQFTPDGATLISGGEDGTLRLWDVRTCQHADTIQIGPPEGRVAALALNPSGDQVAVVTGAGTAQILRWPGKLSSEQLQKLKPATPVLWGKPSPKGMQLALVLDPRREAYWLGEVVKALVILRNASHKEVEFTAPRLEVLEKLGFELALFDEQGKKLPWHWGQAHKSQDSFTVSGGLSVRLKPGEAYQLAEVELLLGGDANPTNVIAKLDVDLGQSCRLACKLATYGYAKDEGEPLESGTLEFRVVDGGLPGHEVFSRKQPVSQTDKADGVPGVESSSPQSAAGVTPNPAGGPQTRPKPPAGRSDSPEVEALREATALVTASTYRRMEPWGLADIAKAQLAVGDVEAGRETFRRAVAVARVIKDGGPDVYEVWRMAAFQMEVGEFAAARETVRLAADAIPMRPAEGNERGGLDLMHWLQAMAVVANGANQVGLKDVASKILERTNEFVREAGPPANLNGSALAYFFEAKAAAGDFDGAFGALDAISDEGSRAIALAGISGATEAFDVPTARRQLNRVEAAALGHITSDHLQVDLARAYARIGEFPAALNSARRIAHPSAMTYALRVIGEEQRLQGDAAGAKATLNEAFRIASTLPHGRDKEDRQHSAIFGVLCLGDIDTATKHTEVIAPGWRHNSLRVIAKAHRAKNDRDAAARMFQLAMRDLDVAAMWKASEVGVSDEQWAELCSAGRARVLAAMGDADAAHNAAKSIARPPTRYFALRDVVAELSEAGRFDDAIRIVKQQVDPSERFVTAQAIRHGIYARNLGKAESLRRARVPADPVPGDKSSSPRPPRTQAALIPPDQKRIAELIRQLLEGDPPARAAAVEELARVGKAAVPALIEAMKREGPGIREPIAETLVKIGPDAVPLLIEGLSDENELVRARSVWTLPQLGLVAKPAIPALIEALIDDDPWVHEGAQEALINLWEESRPALVQALGHKNSRIRAWATETLGRHGPGSESAYASLIAMLKDVNSTVRQKAAEVLVNSPVAPPYISDPYPPYPTDPAVRADVVQTLIALLGAEDDSMHPPAIILLTGLGPQARAAVPLLVDLVRDPTADAAIRTKAAWALGEVGPNAAAGVGPLTELLQHKNEGLRIAAAVSLWKINRQVEPVLPVLIESVQNKEFAWDVAPVLGKMGPAAKRAVPALMKAWELDDWSQFRRIIAEAMGEIGPDARPVVPLLEDAITEHYAPYRLCAARALWRITGEPQTAVSALSEIFQWRLKGWLILPDELVAAAALLGEIGPPAKAAVDVLTKTLDDKDETVRAAVRNALQKISPKPESETSGGVAGVESVSPDTQFCR